MTLTYSLSSLPVLYKSDCIVAGGSFAGISSALVLAQNGRSVTLVEPRTYLGREVTAVLRPWLRPGSTPVVSWLQPLIKQFPEGIDEVPLHLDQLKIYLEDLLLSTGINLLYASTPVQILEDEKGVIGIAVGNKSGRQVVLGRTLIDANENALCTRLAGAEFIAPPTQALYFNTLELTGAGDFPETSLSIPETIGVIGNQVTLHRSFTGRDPMYIEFALSLPATGDLPTSMNRDISARQVGLRLASHLLTEQTRFYWGNWTGSSYELHGPQTSHLTERSSNIANPSIKNPYDFEWSHQSDSQISLADFSGPLTGLWCLSEAARFEMSGDILRDPVSAAYVGEELAKAIMTIIPDERKFVSTITKREVPKNDSDPLKIKELETPVRSKSFDRLPIPIQSVPVVERTQVLVVGGGTSGSVAAIASAQLGASTSLVEMQPGLGGTGTLGGVVTPWMSNRVGFVPRIRQAVEVIQRQLNFQPRPPWIIWNQQAKMMALLNEIQQKGINLLWNAVCFGVVMEEEQVCGAVFATRYGPVAILANAVVDASGDGDLAAFAGADWVVGDEYTADTMWTAFPYVPNPGEGNSGNFTSAIDVTNILDLTRGILVGRRRNHILERRQYRDTKEQEEKHNGLIKPVSEVKPTSPSELIHDHGVYMAPRESRHIWGDVILTHTDQLRQRKWEDVITICFSNYDVKGQTTSDWNRIGLLPPNLYIEIPYRALLPKKIEGLIVAGKAFSARSDAVPSIRMQPDMENLGGAAGMAAAMAAMRNTTLRNIETRHLQRELIKIGVLPDEVLERNCEQPKYTDEELIALVQQISTNPSPWEYNNMGLKIGFYERIPLVEVICTGDRATPILERALLEAQGERKILLAQALALLGSQAGVPFLVQRLQELFSKETLPERKAFMFNANREPPDQGVMPEPVYLLYSLGMIRDKRSLPVMDEAVDLLSFSEIDFWHPYKAPYCYIDAVCYGLENLGDPDGIPILERLHNHSLLNGLSSIIGFEPDFIQERKARLELEIGRALARSGSRDGYEILINYLEDARGLLAEAAERALVDITGQKIEKDPSTWRRWLRQTTLKPIPRQNPVRI